MKCPKCGKRRPTNGRCKFCKRIQNNNQTHTVIGLLRRRYTGMKFRSKKRGWPAPNMTREEFIETFKNDESLLRLFYIWRDFNWNKKKSPSIDRIEADLPYQRGNLQWLSWENNWNKSFTADHLKADTVQLSLAASPSPMVTMDKKELKKFTIKPTYSFQYGAFLFSKSQYEKVLMWDSKKEALGFCNNKYNACMIREIIRLQPGKNGRTLIYGFGIMHNTEGFLER